jgi:hypothetical protein
MLQTILVAFVSGVIFDCATFAPNGVVRGLGSAAEKEKGPAVFTVGPLFFGLACVFAHAHKFWWVVQGLNL